MNDIEILEELCNRFKYQQSKLDELERDDYAELIQDIEIIAIENLIARNKELEEYANWHISHLTEDIADYIDDDKIGNRGIIGELKEEREHWRDIKRIMNNEKTYIDFRCI